MEIEWKKYTDAGDPVFRETAGPVFKIERVRGDRGRWLGVYPEDVKAGDEINFKANVGGLGKVIATFWEQRIGSGSFVGAQDLGTGEIDVVVIVKDRGTIVRFELRGWSEVAAGQTVVDTFSDIVIGEDGAVIPDAPALAAIDNADRDGDFLVSWSAVDGAELYRLEEQENNLDWVQIYEGSGTSFEALDRADGKWTYRARARAGGESSDYSNVESTIVETAVTELDAPEMARIDNPEWDENFLVSWSAVDGAESYQLEEQKNSGDWVPVYEGSETSFEALDWPNGHWAYRARAHAGGKISDWSNVEWTAVNIQMMLIHHLVTPNLEKEWIVTISDESFSAVVRDLPAEGDAQDFIDKLAATEPDFPAELLPPDFGH